VYQNVAFSVRVWCVFAWATGIKGIRCIRESGEAGGGWNPVIERIVSGGQTGVDRAALEVALSLGIPCGGWCPRGRRAEDGRIPACFPLQETFSASYSERTEWNVRDADGTLIVASGPLSGGTSLTRAVARRLGRPVFVVDLRQESGLEPLEQWLANHRIRVLNVAGPRESQQPGIQALAEDLLRALLTASG